MLKSRIDGLASMIACEQYLVFSQFYYVFSQYHYVLSQHCLASFSLLSDKLPRIIRFQFVSASDYIKLLFTFSIRYWPRVATITALMVCMRFSASSNTIE